MWDFDRSRQLRFPGIRVSPRYFCAILGLIIISATSPLRADPADVSETSEQSKIVADKNPDKIAEDAAEIEQGEADDLPALEAKFAEAAYQRIKSNENRNLLVEAYEKIMAVSCFKDMFVTFEYGGASTDKRCLDYIDRTLEIDGSNALALCARFGMRSEPCLEAFRLQEYSRMGDSGNLQQETAAKMSEARIEQGLNELQNELNPLLKSYSAQQRKNNVDPNLRKKIKSIYQRMLAVACASWRLDLKPPARGSPPRMRVPPPTPKPADRRPLKEVLAELAREKEERLEPTAVPIETAESPSSALIGSGPDLQRSRVLTQRCFQSLDQAFKFDRTMAAAVCHREGFYSPGCLAAMRAERDLERQEAAKLTPHAPATPKSRAPGFSTF